MRKTRKTQPLEPLELPQIGNSAPELTRTVEALSEELHPEPDPRYPPHDDEAFQAGYPHKGDGKYGSPGQF